MKVMKGIVTSKKMQKTVVVTIDRLWRHPLYKKTIKKTKKFLVHDEIGVNIGDKVEIQQTAPISKRKKWKIVKNEKKTKTT